jgi:hypothetical protein
MGGLFFDCAQWATLGASRAGDNQARPVGFQLKGMPQHTLVDELGEKRVRRVHRAVGNVQSFKRAKDLRSRPFEIGKVNPARLETIVPAEVPITHVPLMAYVLSEHFIRGKLPQEVTRDTEALGGPHRDAVLYLQRVELEFDHARLHAAYRGLGVRAGKAKQAPVLARTLEKLDRDANLRGSASWRAAMHESTQLQFKLLGREAQSAILYRLALRGASLEDIARQTGLSPEAIRACLGAQETELTEGAAQFWRRRHSNLSRATTK